MGDFGSKTMRNVILVSQLPIRLSPGQKWHTHRKMITPAFHFSILESFVEVFSEKSEILISKLQEEVGSKGFNVCPYITKCTLDIICGERMGCHIHGAVYPIIFLPMRSVQKLVEQSLFAYACSVAETAMGTPIHAQDDRGSNYVKAVHE